jgi:hypothetical protein
MNNRILAVGACLLAAAAVSTRPASAIGPVDVEVGAGYWDADTEISELNASESASAPALFGNVWLKNALGFGVSRYEASPGGSLEGADSDFTAVDAKWRFLNATRNNFVAVGLGGEQVAIANESTIAPRLVVEGHVSVKLVYFFGKGAYLPTIGEMGEGVDGKDGMELEAGVGFHPIPLLSVQLSYKSNDMDFEVTDPLLGTANMSVNNAGPMLGLVFSF